MKVATRSDLTSYFGLLDQKAKGYASKLSTRFDTTIELTVLALFVVLLHRYFGDSAINVLYQTVPYSRIGGSKNLKHDTLKSTPFQTKIEANDVYSGIIRKVKNRIPVNTEVEEQSVAEPVHCHFFYVKGCHETDLSHFDFQLHNIAYDRIEPFVTCFIFVGDETIELLIALHKKFVGRFSAFQIHDGLRTLLISVMEDDTRKISLLPIITDKEKEKILYAWNKSNGEISINQTVHALFQEQARKSPHNPALIYNDKLLTYSELNFKSNQLAYYLIQKGLKPQERVGIHLERSIDLVIALLAVLKAAAVFVPLDVNYPKDRVLSMARDSKVSIILSSLSNAELFKETRDLNCLIIRTDNISMSHLSGFNPESKSEPDDIMYLIYTSGSTGKPKGAAIPHKQLVNRLFWMWREYPFENKEVLCLKTSINFVDSMWEVFGALLKGLPVVIATDSDVKSPDEMVCLLSVNNVSRIMLVPTYLQLLLTTQHELGKKLPKLKIWCVGGEDISPGLCQQFFKQVPDAKLYNGYGLSETFDVTWHQIKNENSIEVKIGKPIDNTEVYILDHHFNPVPVGVTGEIFIGSIGLTKGYVNMPDLNREVFVENKFNKNFCGRLFRTGDLAYYCPDGSIKYVGRKGSQVKIKGFRIELTEIEMVLASHPKVGESAVVVQTIGQERKNIVGFVITNDQTTNSEKIKEYASSKLPQHMVPSKIVVLDEFPQTSSRKIDRLALSSYDVHLSEHTAKLEAASTDIEKVIADLCEEIHGVGNIDVSKKLIDIGFDSLTGIQVITKVKSKLGYEFNLQELLSHSINELAFEIEINKQEKANHFIEIVI